MADLFTDFLAGEPALAPFHAAPPRALLEKAPAAVRLDAALVEEVNRDQERLGATGRLPAETVVVCTGQQPGLFLGPLYTVYKAATAVLLAKRIANEFAVSAAPVFWLGADDHDFEEARTVHLLDRDGQPVEFTYTPASDVTDRPLHGVPVEEQLHRLVDEARAVCPGSMWAEEVTEALHATLEQANSFADWSALLLARLFRDTPLVVSAPHRSAARAAARPVLARAIDEPVEATRLTNGAGERLEALGYEPQLVKGEDEAGFFVEVDGRRRKVVWRDGRFLLPETGGAWSREEMRAMLAESPARFSPNVTLRPVVQQELLKPAAYVAGPGEVAYWAQLKPVFEAHGQPMPAVYPRVRCALTTIKLNKLLRRNGLRLDDLTASQQELLPVALAAQPPTGGEEAFQRHRPAVLDAAGALRSALDLHDATAARMAHAMRARIEHDLNRIERRLARADEERVRTVEAQVARLQDALAPFRKPQERVYSVVSFLFAHGWELVPNLLQTLDVESFAMQEVEL